ncbi:hypothetical protein CDD81_6864 [Ophiocordyceps australis]|uniref:Uncharacterized protein n=1 Tax=Ophiocordyceps australis TaxID=1399860 RepID=A0A2C5Y5C0_9HYPO|nr:hypothetical protein CDD81_6864 [Ophiocordyceps australis]
MRWNLLNLSCCAESARGQWRGFGGGSEARTADAGGWSEHQRFLDCSICTLATMRLRSDTHGCADVAAVKPQNKDNSFGITSDLGTHDLDLNSASESLRM